MRKICALLAAAFIILSAAGCSKEQPKPFPTDDEIMSNISAYLGSAVLIDPAIYPSKNDFLKANLGLGEENVSNVILYMGAPNQNTTYFVMITKAKNADSKVITDKLESIMQGCVKTAEMGYISGYTEYSIIEKGDKIFAIMHESPEGYSKMLDYLNSL